MTSAEDVVQAARAAVDDGWAALAPATRARVQRELVRTVFGTLKETGLAGEISSLRRLLYIGGGASLVLQVITALQLQEPLKRAIVLAFGGH